MIRVVLAVFAALGIVLLSGGQAATPGADAGAATDLSLELDCDVATNGVQSACTLAPGATTTNVDVVLRNNSASPFQLGRFDVTVLNPDISRLNAPLVVDGGGFNSNPDAHPAVSGPNWACSPPAPNNDADGNPNTQSSYIDCRDGVGDGAVVGAGETQVLATVHYNVPAMAQPGAVGLSIASSSVGDPTWEEAGSCPTQFAPMNCAGATVTIPRIEVVVDCLPALGITTSCAISNLLTSRDIGIHVRNLGAGPITIGSFSFTLVSPDVSRLSAFVIDNPGTLNDNPNAASALGSGGQGWNCGPPDPSHDLALDADPATHESFISCSATNSTYTVMGGMSLQVAQVHYQIPAGADPGAITLQVRDVQVTNAAAVLVGSCRPTLSVGAQCVDAVTTFFCPIDQADVNNDGRVNSLDIGIVASKYGQLPPPAGYDQNFDGVINSIDIGIMASHFNKFVTQCP